MDYIFWKNFSSIVAIIATCLAFIAAMGSHIFGNLADMAAPFLKPIRSASATVEVIIDSDDDINTNFGDRGGYFLLGKGSINC